MLVFGAGVTSGYLARPDLTDTMFILDNDGAVIGYRSGDWAFQSEDGDYFSVGRRDRQVKLRGFRIELGEVEARVASFPEVRVAVCVVESPGSGGIEILTCFIESRREFDAVMFRAVREHVRQALPDYMVPARFRQVGALPVTANGKLDTGKLQSAVVADRGDADVQRVHVATRQLDDGHSGRRATVLVFDYPGRRREARLTSLFGRLSDLCTPIEVVPAPSSDSSSAHAFVESAVEATRDADAVLAVGFCNGCGLAWESVVALRDCGYPKSSLGLLLVDAKVASDESVTEALDNTVGQIPSPQTSGVIRRLVAELRSSRPTATSWQKRVRDDLTGLLSESLLCDPSDDVVAQLSRTYFRYLDFVLASRSSVQSAFSGDVEYVCSSGFTLDTSAWLQTSATPVRRLDVPRVDLLGSDALFDVIGAAVARLSGRRSGAAESSRSDSR